MYSKDVYLLGYCYNYSQVLYEMYYVDLIHAIVIIIIEVIIVYVLLKLLEEAFQL